MAAGKSSRINRQYKTKYRIRNWREYERGLRSRGDASLKADIAGLDGAASLVETTSAGYGEGKMAAPSRDWSQMRIGAAPPDVLEALRISAGDAVLAACGVPPALASTRAEGGGQRESFR